jgi:hypothetical protein
MAKTNYRVSNRREYNEALKQRGSLTFWLNPELDDMWYAPPSGKKGAQPVYTDLAIKLVRQLGIVFNQRLRQTEGLVESLFKILELDLSVPDYTTLSRRGSGLNIVLSKRKKETVDLVLDSSGLKIFGEGEWKIKKHGKSKRRTWRKVHIAITPDGEIRAVKTTKNNITDARATKYLLDQEESRINSLTGDGGYDKQSVYDLCQKLGIANVRIPPQKNAKIWQHGNSNSPPHPRDENLRKIRQVTRKCWKEQSGYHIRSLVETAMHRNKIIFGGKLYARCLERQITEVMLRCDALNRMLTLGMPTSYAIA